MSSAIIGFFLNIAMTFFTWFIEKRVNDKELKDQFRKFAELARKENIKSIVDRRDVENQLAAGDKKWKELEQQQKGLTDGQKIKK
jgi:hypothetical protein